VECPRETQGEHYPRTDGRGLRSGVTLSYTDRVRTLNFFYEYDILIMAWVGIESIVIRCSRSSIALLLLS